ncbi:MAG: polymerase [Proteobacteria bacterium]|nr:polymerase [Pseudomonadota bacterium]
MGTASRKIIHIDMDAFFAAVEQRDFPEYRNRPVIVGGAPDSRGVVATCSYEARTFGIRSAMPSSQAYRLCPQAVFLRPRFDVYRDVSGQIRAILLEFTDRVEPLSLDEAYLDVTDCGDFRGSATLIAKEIKRRILAKTRLVASAGVSYNKFLAKIASDLDKPDGFCLISPDQGPGFVETLPIGRFHGVGKATEAKMKALGVESGLDLKRFSLEELCLHFGKAGRHYYQIARGIDDRPVIAERPRKSVGAERTFQSDLGDPVQMLSQLKVLTGPVLAKLAERGLSARSLTLKVRYADFELVTRSRTRSRPFLSMGDVVPHLAELLEKTEARSRKVRLLGVSFSMLDPAGSDTAEPDQLDMFT